MNDEQIRALFGLAPDAVITDQIRAAAPLVQAAQPPAPPPPTAPVTTAVPFPSPGALAPPVAGAAGAGDVTTPPAAAGSAPTPAGGTGATPPAGAPPAPTAPQPAPTAPSSAGGPAPAPPPTSAPTPELVTLSAGQFASIQQQAAAGVEALRVLQEQSRETALLSAVQAGKIAPFEIDRWRDLYNAAPEATVKHLSSITPVFPTVAVGSDAALSAAADGEWSQQDQAAYDATFEHVFGNKPPTRS